MFKKYISLLVVIYVIGCIPYFGPPSKTGFGAKHYKYRCNSANDCCEVGKNCEEDLNKEGSKK